MKRKNQTDLLIDAIGNLDDRFIYEAENYVPRKRGASLRRLAIIGVCATLILSLMLAVFIGNGMSKTQEENNDSINSELPPSTPSQTDQGTSSPEPEPEPDFFVALSNFKSETQDMISDFDRDELFDGATRLIWKYEGDQNYRTCTVSKTPSSYLRSFFSGESSFDDANRDTDTKGLEGFWVCFGDGLVYSPCLKNSLGNVGFGELFEYDVELMPSQRFTEIVTSIIQSNLSND